MAFRLEINDDFEISDISWADKQAYIEHLKEKQIHDQTLNIPYPYTEADADWWIEHNIKATAEQGGRSVNWAIRRRKDQHLIGGIGFLDLVIGQSHKAEIGYWLAKPFWHKGIMTQAIRVVVSYGFDSLQLKRVTATCFEFNKGSARVLEKNGFKLEGTLRNHYEKNGRFHNGKYYGLLVEDFLR